MKVLSRERLLVRNLGDMIKWTNVGKFRLQLEAIPYRRRRC